MAKSFNFFNDRIMAPTNVNKVVAATSSSPTIVIKPAPIKPAKGGILSSLISGGSKPAAPMKKKIVLVTPKRRLNADQSLILNGPPLKTKLGNGSVVRPAKKRRIIYDSDEPTSRATVAVPPPLSRKRMPTETRIWEEEEDCPPTPQPSSDDVDIDVDAEADTDVEGMEMEEEDMDDVLFSETGVNLAASSQAYINADEDGSQPDEDVEIGDDDEEEEDEEAEEEISLPTDDAVLIPRPKTLKIGSKVMISGQDKFGNPTMTERATGIVNTELGDRVFISDAVLMWMERRTVPGKSGRKPKTYSNIKVGRDYVNRKTRKDDVYTFSFSLDEMEQVNAHSPALISRQKKMIANERQAAIKADRKAKSKSAL